MLMWKAFVTKQRAFGMRAFVLSGLGGHSHGFIRRGSRVESRSSGKFSRAGATRAVSVRCKAEEPKRDSAANTNGRRYA